MPRRPRSADDNPLVILFMLVFLVAVAVVGVWRALREQPLAHARYAAPTIGAQPTANPGSSGSPTGFVDAFKRLPEDATSLQRAYDAGFDDAARSLGDDDLAWVKQVTSRNARSRDAFTDDELDTLRRHGFGNWVDAQAVRWSQDDPAFKTVSMAVWERSPRVRGEGALTELAVRWGAKNRTARQELLRLVQVAEGKGRALTAGERAALSAFAGEEYLANRP